MRTSLLLFLLFPAALFARPDTLWTRTFGGPGDQVCHRLIKTLDGGFAMVGSTTNGAGGKDGYFLITTQNGTQMLERIYGGGRDDEFCDILQMPTREYMVAGTTHSFSSGGDDFWLLKLSSLGDTLWTQVYGGIGDQRCVALQQANDGGFILAGNEWPFMDPNPDMILVKTDADGNELWTGIVGDDGVDLASGAQVLPQGGYLMAGTRPEVHNEQTGTAPYLVRINAVGDPVWESYYTPLFPASCAAIRPADHGYVMATTAAQYSHSGEGIYTESMIIKITTAGITEWAMPCGIPYDDELHDVAEASDSSYFGVGSRHVENLPTDGFLVKVNYLGDTLWTAVLGDTSEDSFESVLPLPDGRCAVAGYTRSYSRDHDADIWLVMMDTTAVAVGPSPLSPYPLALSLSAFPNPFNPSTQISFALPKAQRVKVEVFNVAGRAVRTLSDQVYPAGEHRLEFDGKDLTSGIYFARLSAEGVSQTQKLLLLR